MLLHVPYVTFALAWQDHSPDVHTTNDTTASSSSSTDESSRSTDHTIRYDTWVGYNSTWKYFKVTLHVLMDSKSRPCGSAERGVR